MANSAMSVCRCSGSKNRIAAKILIEEFRRQFNEILGQLTPEQFKQTLSNIKPAKSYFLSIQRPEECR